MNHLERKRIKTKPPGNYVPCKSSGVYWQLVVPSAETTSKSAWKLMLFLKGESNLLLFSCKLLVWGSVVRWGELGWSLVLKPDWGWFLRGWWCWCSMTFSPKIRKKVSNLTSIVFSDGFKPLTNSCFCWHVGETTTCQTVQEGSHSRVAIRGTSRISSAWFIQVVSYRCSKQSEATSKTDTNTTARSLRPVSISSWRNLWILQICSNNMLWCGSRHSGWLQISTRLHTRVIACWMFWRSLDATCRTGFNAKSEIFLMMTLSPCITWRINLSLTERDEAAFKDWAQITNNGDLRLLVFEMSQNSIYCKFQNGFLRSKWIGGINYRKRSWGVDSELT